MHTTTAKGYMTTAAFQLWLEHLRAEVQHSDKIVLIVDNHTSHASAAVQGHARRLNIVLVYLPPNTTHALQPMDQYNQRLNYFRAAAYRRLVGDIAPKLSQELGVEVVLSALEELAENRHKEVVAAWRACGITAARFDASMLRQKPRDDTQDNKRLSLGSDVSDLPFDSQNSAPVTPRTSRVAVAKFRALREQLKACKSNLAMVFAREQGVVAGRAVARRQEVDQLKSKKMRVAMSINGTASGPEIAAAMQNQQARQARKAADLVKKQREAELIDWLRSKDIDVSGTNLQVEDLRLAAAKLNVDRKGTKKVLLDRLLHLMADELGGPANDAEIAAAEEQEDDELQINIVTGITPAENAAAPVFDLEDDDTDLGDETDGPEAFDADSVGIDEAFIAAVLSRLTAEDKKYWEKMVLGI